MSSHGTKAFADVHALRASFDQHFAAPQQIATTGLEKFVIISIGANRFAIRVSEIARIEVNRKVVPLPRSAPALLGLAGIRGKLVPVYSLAVLLGEAPGRTTRWLALSSSEEPLGLAFDNLEQFVEVAGSAVCAVTESVKAGRYVPFVLRMGTASFGVVSLPSILTSINASAGRAPGKER